LYLVLTKRFMGILRKESNRTKIKTICRQGF